LSRRHRSRIRISIVVSVTWVTVTSLAAIGLLSGVLVALLVTGSAGTVVTSAGIACLIASLVITLVGLAVLICSSLVASLVGTWPAWVRAGSVVRARTVASRSVPSLVRLTASLVAAPLVASSLVASSLVAWVSALKSLATGLPVAWGLSLVSTLTAISGSGTAWISRSDTASRVASLVISAAVVDRRPSCGTPVSDVGIHVAATAGRQWCAGSVPVVRVRVTVDVACVVAYMFANFASVFDTLRSRAVHSTYLTWWTSVRLTRSLETGYPFACRVCSTFGSPGVIRTWIFFQNTLFIACTADVFACSAVFIE